jgi:ATP-dependent DNA helicase PIF1
MSHRFCFEAVDRMLRDIRVSPNKPFGGITTVLGGDFRQILPVVLRANPVQSVESSVSSSPLWQHVEVLHLTQNMRLDSEQQQHAQWLIQVGEGRIGERVPNEPFTWSIPIPQCMQLENKTLTGLIEAIYPNFEQNFQLENYFADRMIMAAENEHVDIINAKLVEKIPNMGKSYLSADSIKDATPEQNSFFPPEFLNTLQVNGLPPHHLVLKQGMMIIMLRNMSKTLSNGTRLKITRLWDNVIQAQVVHGKFKGEKVFIHRVSLSSGHSTLPFEFYRKQFPIKPCYAMSINKSQGQTIKTVGLYFWKCNCFAHGQLYVALSRAKNATNIKILSDSGRMLNVVYPQALEN